jgi:hypothetical protein
MRASNFLQKYLAAVPKLPLSTSELAKLKYSILLVTRVLRSIPWSGTIPTQHTKSDLELNRPNYTQNEKSKPEKIHQKISRKFVHPRPQGKVEIADGRTAHHRALGTGSPAEMKQTGHSGQPVEQQFGVEERAATRRCCLPPARWAKHAQREANESTCSSRTTN